MGEGLLVDQQAKQFSLRIDKIELGVKLIESDLPKPIFASDADQITMYRYGKTDIRHFAFLHSARLVSTCRVSVLLFEHCYPQELFTLFRTVIEFTSKIDFVANDYFDEDNCISAKKYVSDYFSDFRRSPQEIYSNRAPNQKNK